MNLKQNYQSGRSMVEMLGVLAVIGVLSIGGIAGYNYAISKHRANQVLQDIRLLYQELKYPNIVRQIVSEGFFPDTELDLQSPYEYDFDFENPDNFNYDSTSEKTPNLISVNVLGVSKTACDILLKTKPEYVLMLKANGESTWNCTQDENKLSYIFEITTDKLEYRTCSVCTGDHCFDDDLNCPEGETCQNDVCSKCKHGYVVWGYNNQCISCDFNWKEALTPEKCQRCGGIYGNDTHQGNNLCEQCKGINLPLTKEECQTCMDKDSNVVWLGNPETNKGLCTNCKNRFTFTTKAYENTKEQCFKCADVQGGGQFVWYPKTAGNNLGLCARCDVAGGTANTDHSACTCPNGKFWNFSTDQGGSLCWECTESKTPYTSKIECDKCPERYFDGTNDRNGKCYLCPTGQIKSADGKSCVDA